ncbi:alpha-mannosidase [Allorhizobium taibaishanense]|uniref:Alpha-mannosidase n=1 Tax=Allorhizobium taibaishanense TaxID=887144 RepID=A0A1Q9A720_9HYPH|nr:glycoside hydrolase family 38 C-terminal domain-containing protein [Allorhizobium taibaishanense]MBB4008464.1 alpha-mannosidase [Allorhizobium taibaishanense]OLP50368.1 alpha-mannosidase [Allorhizobium taibaishanense]
MTLTNAQRLERLKVRTLELEFWRARKTIAVDGWRFNDAPIALGADWPEKTGTQHFAADIAVPDGWPLDTVRLCLDLGGESLIRIEAADGTAKSFGLDPNHREFPVPSRQFRLTSDTVARLPFGEPVRHPKLTRAELVWIEEDVDALWLLLRQVAEAVETLEGHDVVPHLLQASEETIRMLDWPSATADYIARTAAAPMQQKIWQLPTLKPDPEGLNEAQRESVAKAYQSLMDKLAGLRERFPPQGKVALTGHAHIDLAWLWPYDETRRKVRRTFHTALSLMEGSKDFRFNQSTAHYYAQLEEDDPALLEKVVERVKAGQWETLGGTWIEPDTNMPTGESLSRQILYGQRYFEKISGIRHTICWLPDCFGFSGALPQLLVQGGMKSFFTIKVNWSESNHIPSDLFWWEGFDGSRVLAHTFDNPVDGYNGQVRPDTIASTWRNFRQKDRHDTTLLCVGYGDGGGGVSPEMIRREEQLRVFPALPEAQWTRVEDFFENAHEAATARKMSVWKGEIYLELHRGTLTSQSDVKRLHRKAERSLITAETVASLAHLLGAERSTSMEPEWRVVLKNEFHDILPGSSIAEVYVDARRELEAVIEQGKAAQTAGLERLLAELPEGGDGHILVVNPSLDSRPLRLELADGFISAEGTIPPLAAVVLPASSLAPLHGLSASERHLENAFIRVKLAEDGSIASILHKESGREAVEGGANRLFAYPCDKPRNWDAWDVEEDYAEQAEEITGFDSIELIEKGPHRAAIRIRRSWRHSSIVQTLSLAANARRVEIHTELDWHDRRVLLRTETGVAVQAARAVCECAYGVVERPTHTNTSWDEAMFEAPGHRFIDLSDPDFGLALLNDAKYGHSARGNVLGLSLLRSPVYPDPLADEGYQAFTYALMPHAGPWHAGGVREEAEDLNQPLLAISAEGYQTGTWQPLAVEGITAALSALKSSEDGDDLILRVYEPAGRQGALTVKPTEGWRHEGPVTILEEPMTGPSATGLKPFEVKSWRLSKN